MSDAQIPKNLEKHTSHALGVNLTEAIHLICHAGYPDPRLEDEEGEEGQLLQRVIDALCALSMHDGLTSLSNRRYFQIAIKQETHRAARDGTTCTLLMIDIDHFKSINDRYGHPAGDAALSTVAKRLKSGLRPGDTISRYGGEEFAVILPNCRLKNALHVAERLRLSIADEAISISEQTLISITVSIGAAATRESRAPKPDELIKSADENLYQAKTRGRNQCYSEPPVITEVSASEKSALFTQSKAISAEEEEQ